MRLPNWRRSDFFVRPRCAHRRAKMELAPSDCGNPHNSSTTVLLFVVSKLPIGAATHADSRRHPCGPVPRFLCSPLPFPLQSLRQPKRLLHVTSKPSRHLRVQPYLTRFTLQQSTAIGTSSARTVAESHSSGGSLAVLNGCTSTL